MLLYVVLCFGVVFGVEGLEGGVLYPRLPIAAPMSKNVACRKDSRRLIQNVENQTHWAMQMMDSTIQTPMGVLYGNTFQLGQFDECLGVVAPVRAQYCVAIVTAKLPLKPKQDGNPYDTDANPLESVWQKFRDSRIDQSKIPRDTLTWGLCVPASCQPGDIQEAMSHHLSSLNSSLHGGPVEYLAEVIPGSCTAGDSEPFTPSEILFWVFILSLMLLTVVSTFLDVPLTKEHSSTAARLLPVSKLMSSFSLKQNLRRLLTVENKKDDPFSLFHGLKVLSFIIVFSGHAVGTSLGIGTFNFQQVEEETRKTRQNMAFAHSDLVVDTFFFISALLGCYVLVNTFSNKFLNPLFIIITRLSRLAPLYFVLLWFQASAFLRLGDGPLWNMIAKQEARFCQENWWTNVLFISNYVNTKEMCMQHSWYIPCDFHFFLLSIPLTMLLASRRRAGLVVLVVLAVVSAVVPGLITYQHNLKPFIVFFYSFLSKPRDDQTFEFLYTKSHARLTVYLMGMLTGYYLHTVRDCDKKISKPVMVLGIVTWLALCFAPMAYGSVYYNPERPYYVLESALFASLRRPTWTAGLVVLVLTHRYRRIPVIASLSSSRVCMVLSKLVYSLYLLHFNLLMGHMEATRIPRYYSNYELITASLGYLMWAILYSSFLYLTLELPIKRMVSELMTVKERKDTKIPETPRKSEVELRNVFTVKL